MTIRDQGETFEAMRETDRWLRKMIIYVPILSFVIGWGSGVITTFMVFKNLENRVVVIESSQKEHDLVLRLVENREERILAFLDDKFKTKIE